MTALEKVEPAPKAPAVATPQRPTSVTGGLSSKSGAIAVRSAATNGAGGRRGDGGVVGSARRPSFNGQSWALATTFHLRGRGPVMPDPARVSGRGTGSGVGRHGEKPKNFIWGRREFVVAVTIRGWI